jgi:hypothetical protein
VLAVPATAAGFAAAQAAEWLGSEADLYQSFSGFQILLALLAR